MTANMHGVYAKWERAVEQLTTLDKEIDAFCSEPHPYTIYSHDHRKNGRYRFEIMPAWPSNLPYRWGAILGEIVHDFRSALDSLVCQLAILNSGKTYRSHTFPVCAEEPKKGFAAEMRREWVDSNGKTRRGALFGLSDQAVAIIEACQPYVRDDGLLLQRLHALWNFDKHRHLTPITIAAPPARLIPEDVPVLSRDDRLERGTYILEITVSPDTQVEVEPQPPTDITLSDGSPAVSELKAIGKLILIGLLMPAGDLFPEMLGVGMPGPKYSAHQWPPWGRSALNPG
ncbi:MAG: hypothetical protein WB698_04000 [Solirubrobacteraceae bacterium]